MLNSLTINRACLTDKLFFKRARMGRSHEQQKKLKSLSGFRDHYLLLQVPETDISIELSAVTMLSL